MALIPVIWANMTGNFGDKWATRLASSSEPFNHSDPFIEQCKEAFKTRMTWL